MYKINRFFEQIRNVFYYLPTIWKGFDFDHCYLEELMYLKMKKMLKRLKYEAFNGEKRCVKSLKVALLILERRRTDWYMNLTHKYSRKIKLDFVPMQDYELEDWEDQTSLFHFTGLTEKEEKEYSLAIAESYKTEQRDWRIFCDIMNKYFNTWWS